MNNWANTIKILDIANLLEEDETRVAEAAQMMLDKLAALPKYNIEKIDNEKEAVMQAFQNLVATDSSNIAAMNAAMGILYDWADQRVDDNGTGTCWIERWKK